MGIRAAAPSAWGSATTPSNATSDGLRAVDLDVGSLPLHVTCDVHPPTLEVGRGGLAIEPCDPLPAPIFAQR